jgi:phage shock protein PspC (stress-responsive transcriptional regulator)
MDDEATTTATEIPPPPPDPATGPVLGPSLHRSISHRVVAGVARGISDRFGVAPWVVRAGFIVLIFAAGVGALLYLAGWLLIPEEGTDRSVLGISSPGDTSLILGVGLIGIGLAVLLGWMGIVRADLVVGTALVVCGILLYRWNPSRSGADVGQSAYVYPTDGSQTSIVDRQPVLPPPPPPPPKPRKLPSMLGRLTVAVGLVAIGVVALLDVTGVLAPTALHYLGIGLGVIALGLLVGSFWGRARWLVIPGLLVLPLLLAARFSQLTWDYTATNQVIRPLEVDDLLPEYRIDTGSLLLDLGALELDGADVAVEVSVGAGELIVQLPEGAEVNAVVTAQAGEIEVLGQHAAGLDIRRAVAYAGDEGSVNLDASVGIGTAEVRLGRERPFLDPRR